MSPTKVQAPPANRAAPAKQKDVPSQSELEQRREAIHARHKAALAKVDELVRSQKEVGKALDQELSSLRQHGETLNKMEAEEADTGMLAMLTRRFNARRHILGRRSVAEGLLRQYEVASTRLRQASAFSDELRLCALELQEEVDRLHAQHSDDRSRQRALASRILDLEEELEALERGETELSAEARARRLDALTFELRSETLSLELLHASAQMCKDQIGPSRTLRDTVLELHEGMATYLISASGSVDAAGRKIQALGMAADAPMVIAELQESLTELGTAMEVTATYVRETQELVTRVLPELSARVEAETEGRSKLIELRLEDISRERAKSLADQALRDAAEAEVEAWLRDDEDP